MVAAKAQEAAERLAPVEGPGPGTSHGGPGLGVTPGPGAAAGGGTPARVSGRARRHSRPDVRRSRDRRRLSMAGTARPRRRPPSLETAGSRIGIMGASVGLVRPAQTLVDRPDVIARAPCPVWTRPAPIRVARRRGMRLTIATLVSWRDILHERVTPPPSTTVRAPRAGNDARAIRPGSDRVPRRTCGCR